MELQCRIGTRKSLLARTQAQSIANALTAKGVTCQLVEIVSEGDRNLTRPLYEIESEAPGLFCKQLQEALLANRIDLAVHSLKDLPTLEPQGLALLAVPKREAAGDCLIIHPDRHSRDAVWQLTSGAQVGTSSLRREAQLLEKRADLKVTALRGNVPSRVDQVRSGKLDAAVLAVAGLNRLQLDLRGTVRVDLPPESFISAPAQGALGLEVRTDISPRLKDILQSFTDPLTAFHVRVERRILREMEGGCTLPLGVWCHGIPTTGQTRVWAFLGVSEGSSPRAWTGFHRFDICATDEETLVFKTVEALRASAGRKNKG